MNPLLRLLRFSRPYSGRLIAAFLWMILYAAGAAGLAKLIQNVFDERPPSFAGGFRVGTAALNMFDMVGRRGFIGISRRF